MSDLGFWILIVIIAVVGAIFCVALYKRDARATDLETKLLEERGRSKGLQESYDKRSKELVALRSAIEAVATQETRYEVKIADWVQDEGDVWEGNPMRFRWAIFDADRYLYPLATDGLDDAIDMMKPLMLGNAPTRAEAEVQALTWVATQEQPATVVLS